MERRSSTDHRDAVAHTSTHLLNEIGGYAFQCSILWGWSRHYSWHGAFHVHPVLQASEDLLGRHKPPTLGCRREGAGWDISNVMQGKVRVPPLELRVSHLDAQLPQVLLMVLARDLLQTSTEGLPALQQGLGAQEPIAPTAGHTGLQ